MPKRTTLKDIAIQAGVGVATVDRVLNGRAPVTAKTASRVLEAAETLNYHAQRLMRRRVDELAPAKTLGFILQKKSKWFYQSLAKGLRDAAATLGDMRASVRIAFVESLSPDDLAGAIKQTRSEADTIGLVAVDHPKVSAAVADCAKIGVPVFALLSPLNAPALAGYIGIDGRKAGRTAGWAMSRLVAGKGDVGMLIGSHRYLGHEEREVGFRSYMREFAPGTRLRESVVYMDDEAVAYEAAAEILRAAPALSGLYHCGGGVEGVIRALAEAGRDQDVFYICHERSPAAAQGLMEGAVDLVIANPMRHLAETTLRIMAETLTGKPPDTTKGTITFDLITSENI